MNATNEPDRPLITLSLLWAALTWFPIIDRVATLLESLFSASVSLEGAGELKNITLTFIASKTTTYKDRSIDTADQPVGWSSTATVAGSQEKNAPHVNVLEQDAKRVSLPSMSSRLLYLTSFALAFGL